MDERTDDDVLRFIAAWRVAGAYLERDRARRLREMTDDQCREIIAGIFAGPKLPGPPRLSGLVEQQRLFRKLR